MTPGQFLLKFYHQPFGRLRDSLRNGGPWQERRTERGRAEMEAAAYSLPLLPVASSAPLELHLLTGRRFWYQTVFCLWTLGRQTLRPLRPVIYDDGTLTKGLRAPLARLFPAARFVDCADTVVRLNEFLPADRFPTLRERWENYPNLRKLTDPHLGSTGWKLVLDSDLLFFRRPEFLLHWLDAPDRPLHAVDCEESYGYSRALMERLAGAPIPPLVNVGLCGLRSESLDWNEIEAWCAELIAHERTSYYLEQALVAMLVARAQPCAVAPAADYITMPHRQEGSAPHAVMHHYVAASKRSYFRDGWRLVMPKVSPAIP